MSRSITIGYRHDPSGYDWTWVEVRSPYDLFGTTCLSKDFWSLPRLREIGLSRLTELGVTDPVYFVGWDDISDLNREIGLLREHLLSIDCDYPELLAEWLAHLVYCHSMLVLNTPAGCIPELHIG